MAAFNSLEGGCNVIVDDALDDVDFDGDGDEHKVQISDELNDEEKNIYGRKF